jgi:uncharacterized protein YciI
MDYTGGLVIVTVNYLNEAAEIVRNDPAVLENIYTYIVHPCDPLEGILK